MPARHPHASTCHPKKMSDEVRKKRRRRGPDGCVLLRSCQAGNQSYIVLLPGQPGAPCQRQGSHFKPEKLLSAALKDAGKSSHSTTSCNQIQRFTRWTCKISDVKSLQIRLPFKATCLARCSSFFFFVAQIRFVH